MARKYNTEPQAGRSSGGGLLRLIIVLGAVLGVAALLMRVLFPTPKTEVYNPPPPPKKTVAEIEKQIKEVKANKNIPDSAKGRILGFLNADLEKAKAAPPPASAQ